MNFKKAKLKFSIILTWTFILCFLFLIIKISDRNTSIPIKNNNIVIKEQNEEIAVEELLKDNSLLLFSKNPL